MDFVQLPSGRIINLGCIVAILPYEDRSWAVHTSHTIFSIDEKDGKALTRFLSGTDYLTVLRSD